MKFFSEFYKLSYENRDFVTSLHQLFMEGGISDEDVWNLYALAKSLLNKNNYFFKNEPIDEEALNAGITFIENNQTNENISSALRAILLTLIINLKHQSQINKKFEHINYKDKEINAIISLFRESESSSEIYDMGITVNLDKDLVASAKAHSVVQSRSVPKQIEHWAKIGRIVEENPDLSYHVIKDFLLGLEDIKAGSVEEYKPGKL